MAEFKKTLRIGAAVFLVLTGLSIMVLSLALGAGVISLTS